MDIVTAAKTLLKPILFWGPTRCPACGRPSRLRSFGAMWPELGREWDLDAETYRQFDQREGTVCALCGNSLRARQLAAVITEQLNRILGSRHGDLRAACQDPRAARLAVAEINSLGRLHPFLRQLPKLRYSEFGSTDPAIPSEDLTALSYGDGAFDIVLTSETLEHVPNVEQALSEIRRVLKPGGAHIFTVPLIWDRATLTRASVENGEIRHHRAPSFHGSDGAQAADLLVFHEFGGDFVTLVENAGFEVSYVRDPQNPALTTFVARRR